MRMRSNGQPPQFLVTGGRAKLLLFQSVTILIAFALLVGTWTYLPSDGSAPRASAESAAQTFADAATQAFAESQTSSTPPLSPQHRSARLPVRAVDGMNTSTPAGTIQVVLPGGLGDGVKTPTGQMVYPGGDAGFDLLAENTVDGARTVARVNGPDGARAVTMFIRTPADTVMLAHTNGYLTVNRATPTAETIGMFSPSEARDANGEIVHSAYVVRQFAPGLYQLSEVIAPTDETAWPVFVDPPISVPEFSFSSITDAIGSAASAVGDAAKTVASATVSATKATANFVKENPLESAMLVGGIALSVTGVGGPAGAAMIASAAVNVSSEVVSVVAAHNPTNEFLGDLSTALDVTSMITPQGAAKKVVKESVEFAVEQTGKHVDDVVNVAKAAPTPPAELAQQISTTSKVPNAPPPTASTPRQGGCGCLASDAKGGVYQLQTPQGGVVKTGRTNDLSRRAGELGRRPDLPSHEFAPVHRTDDYAEQRGLEQELREQHYSTADLSQGGHDRINGVDPNNPRRAAYGEAALRHHDRYSTSSPRLSTPDQLRRQQAETARAAINEQRTAAQNAARDAGQSSGRPGADRSDARPGGRMAQQESEGAQRKRQSTGKKKRKGQK